MFSGKALCAHIPFTLYFKTPLIFSSSYKMVSAANLDLRDFNYGFTGKLNPWVTQSSLTFDTLDQSVAISWKALE